MAIEIEHRGVNKAKFPSYYGEPQMCNTFWNKTEWSFVGTLRIRDLLNLDHNFR